MESAATLLPAAVAAAGTVASVAQQAGIFGGGKPKAVATEAAPTRDTAADALAATQAEEDKRHSWQDNSSSQQLAPTGGVSSDLTGTRMLSRGN